MRINESLSAALLSLLGVLIGVSISEVTDYWLRSRDMDNKMVEVAIDVLKSDCKKEPGIVPARKWAVSILKKYSPVPMNRDVEAALLQNSIKPGGFNPQDFSKDFDIARNPCE